VEFILIGRPFILRWVGTSGLASRSTFYVFIAIFFIRALAQSMELVVVGLSRHKTYAAVAVGEGVLNLLLSLVLVRHLGAFGVALGTLIAQVFFTGWFLPWWAMRALKLGVLPLTRSLITAGVAALAAWLAGRGVVAIVPPQS
jgi:O-antigen/teichoic acid export membrane protein